MVVSVSCPHVKNNSTHSNKARTSFHLLVTFCWERTNRKRKVRPFSEMLIPWVSTRWNLQLGYVLLWSPGCKQAALVCTCWLNHFEPLKSRRCPSKVCSGRKKIARKTWLRLPKGICFTFGVESIEEAVCRTKTTIPPSRAVVCLSNCVQRHFSQCRYPLAPQNRAISSKEARKSRRRLKTRLKLAWAERYFLVCFASLVGFWILDPAFSTASCGCRCLRAHGSSCFGHT